MSFELAWCRQAAKKPGLRSVLDPREGLNNAEVFIQEEIEVPKGPAFT